jgi:hypothetical protein
VAYLAVQAVGRWGWLVPILLGLTSAELLWRLVRLRPELLSLLLLLLALAAAGRGAYRWLGVLAGIYALSYTAFHVLPGLCGLLFLYRGLARKRWDWLLLFYPMAGAGLGLLLHPQLPHNLGIWWVQNVEFFRHKGILDVGTEIRAQRTDEALLHSLGWWLGLVLVWVSARPVQGGSEDAFRQGTSDAFRMAALVFAVLYLLMRRFVIYFIPFATLALLFEIGCRNRRISLWTPMPGRGRFPLPLALAFCVLASLPSVWSLGDALLDPTSGRQREEKWRELGRAVPENAAVAATWGSAQVYALFAPQGRYLNILDPIFMALPYPDLYWTQRALFEGSVPDMPYTSTTALDSNYLAYSVAVLPHLGLRLQGDPRVRWLHQGPDVLVQFLPGANTSFILDWRARIGSSSSWQPYPRSPDTLGQAMEAYVDARRLGSESECVSFRHQRQVAESSHLELVLAPSGSTRLSLDGTPLLAIRQDLHARLSQAIHIPVSLAPGPHILEVYTCPAISPPHHSGFYLQERPSPPASRAPAETS